MPTKSKRIERILAVADVETTWLEHDQTPKTLFWGLAIEGEPYYRFETSQELHAFLESRSHTPLLVYNHHDFDVVQLIVDGIPVRIREVRTGRILRATLGAHEWRNSYAVYPTSLEKILNACGFVKPTLDDLEERNRADTVDALAAFKTLSTRFERVFGCPAIGEPQLTAAGLAFSSAERTAGELPTYLRNRESYRGGRVEAFRVGACGRAELYDINSSYPFAITDAPARDTLHYLDVNIDTDGPCPFFLLTEERDKLLFPRGRFRTCVWESNYERYIRPHGGIKDMRVIKSVECDFSWLQRCAPLIQHAYGERALAKERGDAATEYVTKIGLNSIYGRFGMKDERDIACYGEKVASGDKRVVYYKTPTGFLSFKSVTVTPKANYLFASYITCNARARLYDALRTVRNPLYCDTDSVYCAGSPSSLRQGRELGQWKYEGVEDLHVVSSKDYTWGNQEKRKGGDHSFVWTVKRALAGLPVARVDKHRITRYDKRDVLPDGSTLPLMMEEW